MIIVLKPEATKDTAEDIMAKIEGLGCKPLYMPGSERTVLGAIGDERAIAGLNLESHPLVEKVTAILAPYKLVSREFHAHDSVVDFGGVSIGGDRFTVIAGPCAIESHGQLSATAKAVKAGGARGLRGGAYKPRTSPYAFQGLGEEGLEIMREVSRESGLSTVTEIIDANDVAIVAEHVDAFQVGARNMQNFRLLKELGQTRKPVILKRGMSATVKDLLMAAEYIVSEGNDQVVLCERGIRTFETATRNTLDLNAIPVIKKYSHLPVIVDPSHGTGVRDFVAPMSYAAAACGADGLIVEVHNDPEVALSDGQQSLYPEQFAELMRGLAPFAQARGKEL
jgi:3-deoxy-7-phosphoheptulonate synthase